MGPNYIASWETWEKITDFCVQPLRQTVALITNKDMNQGRFSLFPGRRARGKARGMIHSIVCLLSCSLAVSADGPPASLPADKLRLTWDAPDHASGIYYVKDDGTVTVLVDCPGPEAAELSGEILFGSSTGGPEEDGGFKALSVTPITAARIRSGQRAKIPLNLSFGAAGTYELRWRRGGRTQTIPSDTPGWNLECIFAPRGTIEEDAPKNPSTPWVTTLPRAAARHPGYLADYVQRTTVRRFVIDERFAFDPEKNIGLGFGASTGASVKEIDGLLSQAAAAKVKFILRVTVPGASETATADARTIAAFREYVADAVRRGKGTLAALAIVPDAEATAAEIRQFRACYLAGNETAKRADKNIALLGAGSAVLSKEWLGEANLAMYVDAMAIADAAREPPAARTLLARAKKPLDLLPPRRGGTWAPAAAGLAAGAAMVPVPPPEVDHGVTAHLLGGATLMQRLRVTVPTADPTAPDSTDIPFVAVFQGDGYAVAAIAGFGAGTDLDGLYPGLTRGRTQVEAARTEDAPAGPTLCIGDDTRTMRVVDSAGAPVDCRVGDSLFVPAEDEVFYVLQGGSAADLAGSLRVASGNALPAFEIGVIPGADGLTIRLHNITTRELGGQLRLIRVGSSPDASPATLAESDFGPLGPGKTSDVPLELPHEEAEAQRAPMAVEIETSGSKPLVQRTALPLPVARP
jgi:hypothetical protein